MRIIIETEEKQPAPVVKTTAEETTVTAAMPAIAAGSPPQTLLQSLGEEGTTEAQAKTLLFPSVPETQAGAINAGSPPDWLVQSIEGATPGPG